MKLIPTELNGRVRVKCTQCGHAQFETRGCISTTCKKCAGRIQIGKEDQPKETKQNDLKEFICPYCSSRQNISTKALSFFCRSCHTRISLSDQNDTKAHTGSPGSTRNIDCPYCAKDLVIPKNALSTLCKSCGRHISLQDYTIKGLFNGKVQTKGTLFIKQTGNVSTTAKVNNAVIEGKVDGTINADETVTVKGGATVTGYLVSNNICIEDGAALNITVHCGDFRQKETKH